VSGDRTSGGRKTQGRTAALQRVRRRRRRHRPKLVYVNQGMPRRLRGTRTPRLERQRAHRHCPLWRRDWRGLKPKLAVRTRPPSVVLIYSGSLAMTATRAGDPLSAGRFNRPRDGVQRGSVQDPHLVQRRPAHAGAPVRPPGTRRLAVNEAGTILKIPVLPDLPMRTPNLLLGAPRRPRVAPEHVARQPCRSPTTSDPGPAKVPSQGAFPIGTKKPVYDVHRKKNPRRRRTGSLDHPAAIITMPGVRRRPIIFGTRGIDWPKQRR